MKLFRRDRPRPKWGRAWLFLLVAIVALRVSLPYVVQSYANRVLSENPDYGGHVGDVDINLLMDGYRIQDIEVVRTGANSPVAFLKVKEVDIATSWPALLHGDVVANVTVHEPVVNFRMGVDKMRGTQTGTEVDWKRVVRRLTPTRIDRFEIVDGTVHVLDTREGPDLDFDIRDLDVTATNLTNSLKVSDSLFAHVDMSSKPLGDGTLKAHVDVDPYAKSPTFQADIQARKLPLKAMNKWLLALADIDVEAGTLDVYSEVAAKDGRFEGYLKPMFADVKVFTKQDLEKKKGGPLKKAWEAIVGAAKGVLENEKTEEVAARIPFSGRLDDPKVGVWPAVGSALRNAFVQALSRGLEHSVNLRQLPPTRMHAPPEKKRGRG